MQQGAKQRTQEKEKISHREERQHNTANRARVAIMHFDEDGSKEKLRYARARCVAKNDVVGIM